MPIGESNTVVAMGLCTLRARYTLQAGVDVTARSMLDTVASLSLLAQGTLKWATGERYDGEWANGQENGIGTFTWPDGSTFHGYWEHGKKNGAWLCSGRGGFRRQSSLCFL